eukprot:431618-Prymnesium_polylepis.1
MGGELPSARCPLQPHCTAVNGHAERAISEPACFKDGVRRKPRKHRSHQVLSAWVGKPTDVEGARGACDEGFVVRRATNSVDVLHMVTDHGVEICRPPCTAVSVKQTIWHG